MVEVPLVAQVLNDCGELGSAPLPFVPVRWYGRNAGVYFNHELTETDRYGLTYNDSTYFGRFADRDGFIIAVSGCVWGSFALDVTPGPARYLLMDHMEPVLVTAPDADKGVEINIQLTDEFLNPVTGPQVVFNLNVWHPDCRLATVVEPGAALEAGVAEALAEEIPVPCPYFDQFEGNPSYISYQTTAVGTAGAGHYSTTVTNFLAGDAYVSIYPVTEGIEGRGLWHAFADNLDEDTQWSMPEGSLWEVGTPAAGVGPGAAHSGDTCLGTNLDGPLAFSVEPRPDVASRHIRLDPTYTGICEAILNFSTWHDMGRPCPTDCTNATGLVSFFDMGYEWPYGEPKANEAIIIGPSLDGFPYPGPGLCGEEAVDGPVIADAISDSRVVDERIRPKLWGFGGISNGWRPVTMELPTGDFDCDYEGYRLLYLDAGFRLYTVNGEPLGPGWYVDDLELDVLLLDGRIPFEPGPPETIEIWTEQNSLDNLSDTCLFPWITGAVVLDYWGNPVPEMEVEFLLTKLTATPLAGDIKAPGDAVFHEALEGDDPQFAGDGSAKVTTSERGVIRLAVLDDTVETIRLDAQVNGIDGTVSVQETFSQATPNPGECCDNAIDLGEIYDYYTDVFLIWDYLDNDQTLACEDIEGSYEGQDLVFQFTSAQTRMAYIKYYNCYWYSPGEYYSCSTFDGSYGIELREGTSDSCPGEFPSSTLPGNECQVGYTRQYFLQEGQDYLLTIQAVDPYYDYVYVSISSS
ncbi:MAG: hypothetical protein JW797_03420, partial [Bradymonadales bacterium]|nr:hypothetical protein [Bradymonadales bacterium]